MTTQRMPAVPSDPGKGGAVPRIVIGSGDAQRRMLLTALARTTFDIAPITEEAESAAAVLEILRGDTMDCLITDERLPDMAAAELLGRMRAELAAVPPVVVLADALSQQDATALKSLRWLIREAKQYNTTVSLHINMTDAYEESPLWDEYVAKDCFARDEDGVHPQKDAQHRRREEIGKSGHVGRWGGGVWVCVCGCVCVCVCLSV